MTMPSYQILEDRIDHCMLIDRFRMRRDLKKKKERERLARRIEKSINLAEKRASSIPEVTYPGALPVSANADRIKTAIQENQVVVIAGETGSGKTTQLPKICLEAGRGIFGTIGHTQPRRVAVRTIAHRLAEELEVTPGAEVGYQIRFQDQSTDRTLIKVMTDGVLLAETQNDRFLERYDTIIIDEAHERSLNIDFLLGYIKRILPKRPDLKVIITSATIDVDRFSRHFNSAPVIEVTGRTYPVELHYRPVDEDVDAEPVTQAILDVLAEIETMPKGDVLVFLPGEREIRETAREIKRKGPAGYELLPLYSRLGVAEQNRVFAHHKGRRIVLATNVAETSLTVPGIRYVIDPGLARISRYSIRSKVQQLPIEPVSQASANQRMGRCGRVAEGVCFRLYEEEDFEARPEFTAPEIMRTNLAAVILQMLQLKLGDISKFPFVQRPDQKQINDGYALLFELNAVDRNRHMTRLGKQLARFPVDLRFSRMLIAANQFGCLDEVLVIASGLSIQDPRERPFDQQQASDEMHKKYWDEKSDFMALVNLWDAFEAERQKLSQNQLRKHCRQNFLSFIRMREWREIHRQLLVLCKDAGLKSNKTPAEYASIHRAVLTGLLGHIGTRQGEHDYLGARSRTQFIFPGSSQFSRKPRWVVSAEIAETSRLFARTVAEIENPWIEPLAGHLVQRSYHDPEFDAARGQVVAREEVTLYGLMIVNNRKVDFGSVDIGSARELFIQQGLVDGQLKSRLKFFQQNRRLIRDIERMESKTRKKDILIESRALYDFYDSVLPQDICSELELSTFVNQSSKNADRLRLTKEELMRREANLSEALYPDTLKIGSSHLPLKYRFEPGNREDGVSVDVPLVLLGQVPKAQLDWIVPGLLKEKCLALVRSLPKSIRKNFVPAPDYVDRVLEDFEYDGRPLDHALADRLFRVSGVKVAADDFQTANLDRHLNLNIRVKDEKGKVIAAGRELDVLLDGLADEVSRQLDDRQSHELEQSGLTDWSFGELPAEVEIVKSGVSIVMFPALVDDGDSASIQLFETRFQAVRASEAGILRLYLLRLADQQKYLARNIPGFDKFSLYFATRGSGAELKDNLVRAAFRTTFLEGQSMVRTGDEFVARLDKRGELSEHLDQVSRLAASSLEAALKLEGRAGELAHKDIAEDIKQQLAALLPADFPDRVPFERLRQYPRYLKAVAFRLDRMNPDKDRELMAQVRLWQERFDALAEADQVRLARFRWMLEEFRISLFAQSIGTNIRVSDNRLAKEWESVMGLKL